MTHNWKTVRVFISSTFRDMQAERDHLVRFVFPLLREQLLRWRIHLVDVDLRWGVTSDQDALDLCIDEIDRCHPRFICILGGRYGWIPPPKKLSINYINSLLSGYSSAGRLSAEEKAALTQLYSLDQSKGCYCLREKPTTVKEVKFYFIQVEQTISALQRAGLAEARKSITAAEIHHGALDKLQVPAFRFFYFREDKVTNSIPDPAAKDYREHPDSNAAQMLEQIKTRIRNPDTRGKVLTSPGQEAELPLHWYDYSCRWDKLTDRITDLKMFGDQVFNDLLNSIKAEFGDEQKIDLDEFTEENSAMEAFVEECMERFVLGSRHIVMDEMLAHVNGFGGHNYLCLTGPPGSGKSAMLAALSQHKSITNKPATFLIRHFVGASASSTDIRRTLRRLCFTLKSTCQEITDEIPDDLDKLRMAFKDFLSKACAKKRVVILLDGVNQFDSPTYLSGVFWLPEVLPPTARIIISAPNCPIPDELNCHFKSIEIQMKPLKLVDREAIIEQFQQRFRKKFELVQRTALLDKADAGVPLYLVAALEELRTLGTHEEISQRISELPSTTRELFVWILKRLENDEGFRDSFGHQVGHELVSRFSALLGASRYGLSQRELVDLLDPEDSQGNVAALLLLLRPFLMHRGNLLDFYHGQFRAAACDLWLSKPTDRAETHETLARYFTRTADPEGNGTWGSIHALKDNPLLDHALEEVSYHAYQFAQESENSSMLFALANDANLRQRLFEHSGSPGQAIGLIGYSLEIAAKLANKVQLVHFTMIRTNFVTFLARSYLFRLPSIVRDDGNKQVELARAIARLIPNPDHRRLGLLLIAWMLCNEPLRKPLVIELIREAVKIGSQADACQSAILLEMIGRLYQEGFIEVVALFEMIPPSPIREGYRMGWSTGTPLIKELSERLSSLSTTNTSIPKSELDEFQQIRQFTSRFYGGFTRPSSKKSAVGLEIKMCEIFGLNGAAGGYFLKACDEIQSGNYNAAEILITRGIYICTGSSQPAQRTLAAMAQVFGKLGEKDMAREHEARVRTFDKIAERMARTQEEKAILEDQRRELQISIDLQANKWRAPGSRTLFEQVVRNRGTQNGNGKKEHSDALFSLSNARLLLAEDLLDELPGLLSDLLTVISNAPQNQQPGLYLSTYCLARACNDVSAMHDSASELSKIGIHPEYLFSCPSFTNSTPLYVGSPDLQMSNMVDPSQKVAQILAILSVADTRCYAAVALSVRISGQTRGLFELLRHSACLGLPISTIDTLLCELVQLPDLTSADLRQISDEVLFSGQNLRIPSGLGWYYYPGIMLTSAWVGGVLFAVSFSAARKWDILLPLTGIFMVAGTIGAFADLFLWKVIKLWERPEKSRRYIAELGTIVVFWAAAYLINPHLPQSLKQSGLVAVGFFVGIATLFSVDFVARHRLFNRWLAKDIASGSAVTCLLGILGWWLGKTWLGSEMAQHVLIGLYFTGSLAISFALNIFPKHLSCTKYFDQQEKFSQKDFQ